MDINTLPRYQCHKVVRAAKIVQISPVDNSANVRVSIRRSPDAEVESFFLDAEVESFFLDGGWFARVGPEVNGYLVLYEDGFLSWSPSKAFEEGYTLMDRLGAYEGQKIGDVNPGGPVDGLSG